MSRFEDFRRVALARGVPEAEVADVIQRCYLRILKHIKVFGSESDFRAWCFCLLRSEIMDAGRSRGRRASKLERFKAWAVEKVTEWVALDPLEGMASADRVLLEKHYVEGWSQAKLAAEAAFPSRPWNPAWLVSGGGLSFLESNKSTHHE